MKIPTYDTQGNRNGWVMPIWNALERPDLRPEQVYVTAIAPGTRKGPHLHLKRRGMFACVRGAVLVRYRIGGTYHERVLNAETCKLPLLIIPREVPCAIYNEGTEEALVLNMPSPPWSPTDRDEHPVEEWRDRD